MSKYFACCPVPVIGGLGSGERAALGDTQHDRVFLVRMVVAMMMMMMRMMTSSSCVDDVIVMGWPAGDGLDPPSAGEAEGGGRRASGAPSGGEDISIPLGSVWGSFFRVFINYRICVAWAAGGGLGGLH